MLYRRVPLYTYCVATLARCIPHKLSRRWYAREQIVVKVQFIPVVFLLRCSGIFSLRDGVYTVHDTQDLCSTLCSRLLVFASPFDGRVRALVRVFRPVLGRPFVKSHKDALSCS